MRKITVIILLCCSLTGMALVPPRDPSRWNEWQALITAQQEDLRHSNGRYMPAARQAVGTRTIIPKILVIMANFTDYKLLSSRAEVDSMFNGQNWTKDDAKGSIRQYFHDQSMGAYNPHFDIVGPITLSQGYAYYGSSSTASKMVKEACEIVNDSVDFAQYDLNNDGNVDLVYVLYAGFGENDPPKKELIPVASNLIWPQYLSNAGAGPFDGKYIKACEYSNELDGFYSTVDKECIAGIGVACHEFGHALGLPDMYATSSSHPKHKLLGSWDIMCNGPYNDDMHSPPSFTAYERFFMGWMTPTLITEPDTLTLEHIATSNQAYLISETDTHNMNGVSPAPTVFYLLENRQKQSWDIGIPGNGLMITRINYQPSLWSSNTVNNTADNLGVDLIEADGLTPNTDTDDGHFGKPGDLFPLGATEYTDIPEHAITGITMKDGIITFAYRGGIQPADTDSIVTSVEIPAMMISKPYKTIRDGQLMIHSSGQTYSVYGIKQDD